jgi:hypothetical protein
MGQNKDFEADSNEKEKIVQFLSQFFVTLVALHLWRKASQFITWVLWIMTTLCLVGGF